MYKIICDGNFPHCTDKPAPASPTKLLSCDAQKIAAIELGITEVRAAHELGVTEVRAAHHLILGPLTFYNKVVVTGGSE